MKKFQFNFRIQPLAFLFITTLIINPLYSQKNKETKRTLIISGGGARGSWGGGFAKGLSESGKTYQTVGGTSTGALIMSSVMLNQFNKLEHLFNTIHNEDVYNVNPIRSNGKIRIMKSFWRTLKGRSSIGETKNLRKLIEKIFTEEDYNSIQHQQKTLFCVTTNLNTSMMHIKSIHSNSYTDMLDWIWASASVPVLMKPVHKNGEYWVDGGLTDNVPIDGAIVNGAKKIDVIALFPEKPTTWETSKKIIDIAGRSFHILLNTSFRDHISIGKILSESEKGTELNVYYMSEEDATFLSNLYSFENNTLSEGFKRGYEAFKKGTFTKRTYFMGDDSQFFEKINY